MRFLVYGDVTSSLYVFFVHRLLSSGGSVAFSPSLSAARESIIHSLQEIVMTTKEFPRVERNLFPELKDKPMYLLSVSWEEDEVNVMMADCVRVYLRRCIYTRIHIIYT